MPVTSSSDLSGKVGITPRAQGVKGWLLDQHAKRSRVDSVAGGAT